MLAVYGHGSFFAGHPDARDVDVLVVTDEPLDRREAADRVVSLLDGVPRSLPLDIDVVAADEINVLQRAIAQHGRLLEGDDIVAGLPRVRPFEWAATMSAVVSSPTTTPAAAALSAVRALWAATGRVVVPKCAVVAAAAGGPWDELTAAAWTARHDPTFEHPDLPAVLDAARWAAAGEAATPTSERQGWSSRANRAAVLTIYRQVLTVDEVAAVAAIATPQTAPGYRWTKGPTDDPTFDGLFTSLAQVANSFWWGHDLCWMEPLAVHRHRPGDVFNAHVDRCPTYPTRVLGIVAMIQPATAGGQLYLDLGGERIEPDLAPGDVAIFDSSALHGVTRVDLGERVTLVSIVRANRGIPALSA